MSERELHIGTNFASGTPVYISEKQRSTHMQIIGATGTGKSKLIEHMVRHDIKAGNGLCVLDPHGFLFRDTVKWLQAVSWPVEKTILINPSDDSFATGFNPLRITAKDLSFHVDAMTRACAKVWSEDASRTPLLKRCLRLVFHALAELRLTLLESLYLVSPTNRTAREYLTQKVVDPVIKEQWFYLNSPKMTPKLFYEEVGSTINRLMEFLAAQRLRNILGQTERALDFRELMDEGFIVLVNLASGQAISDDNARLLGSLIVNDFFLAATERPPDSKPFFLYIDECSRYLTEDVARVLDEGRKFGLHLILAHQHLSQLKKAGEEIYSAVMTDAKTKVVFGGLSAEDAQIMAQQLFLGELNLQEPKELLNKPVVIEYRKRWFKSEAQSEGFGTTESGSYGESSGAGHATGWSNAESQSVTPIESPGIIPRGLGALDITTNTTMSGLSSSFVSQSGFSSSSGHSTNHHEAWQEGWSEGLEPILEDRPTAVYSLEEQIWKAMASLVGQGTAQAVLKFPGTPSKRIRTPFVEELPTSSDETIHHHIRRCYHSCNSGKWLNEAKKEIEDRQTLLLAEIDQYAMEKAAEPSQHKQRKKPPKTKEPPSEKRVFVDGHDWEILDDEDESPQNFKQQRR